MAKKKSPNWGKWQFWLIPIIIFVAVVVYLITSQSYTQYETSPTCREVEEAYETTEEYVKTEYYTETVPYTDRECESKNLAYKEDDLERDVTCIEDHEECENYFLGICTSWETVCDVYRESTEYTLTNLDVEKRGIWEIHWKKACRSNQPLCTYEDIKLVVKVNLVLDPTETDTTSQSITYNAKGQEYLFATIYDIPTKQVCRDVIRYQEVQKSRDVTAYRPVTKYKTKTVCD